MQNTINKYKISIKELLIFSFPIIIGQLAQMLISAGDVFVAAKHSTETIAAVSIATAIFNCIFIFGMGFLNSISPVLSNIFGKEKKIKHLLLTSINYSIIVAIITGIITILFIPLIDKLGFEANLIPLIKDYMFISAFSLFGIYLYQGLKEFLQTYEIVMVPNLISVGAIFLNIFLNFVLVFGMFGVPELGVKGLAYASLIVRTLMGLTLLLVCIKHLKKAVFFHIDYLSQLIKVGTPIAFALLLEFIGFNITTVLVARISGLYAASQSIIMILPSLTFMVSLSVSTAMAVKIGYANGNKDIASIKTITLSGLIISISFMSLTALLFALFPEFFIRIFTSDQQIVEICIPIMYLVALFQIVDGIQITLTGVFKGLKMTKAIFIGILIAHWFIGLPLGCLLAFHYNLNLMGFWIGLSTALFAVSIIYSIIIIKKFKSYSKT